MIRAFDIFLALLCLTVLMPLLVLITSAVSVESGSPFFRQVRVGRNLRPFVLVKFRTMHRGTPSLATHLADKAAVTRLGYFLRRTKLDELPQLWNVLKGEMSLVGPRPCLPSQSEVIAARMARGVFSRRPGITGFAQIAGVDMSDPTRLAEKDAALVLNMSMKAYFQCLAMTLKGGGQGDRVRHG